MLPVSALQGVKVYNLSAGKTLPQWQDDSHKKKFSLRYNIDFRSRIELIQDFSFPTASFRIKASPDGKFLVASGMPFHVKVFELDQLGMKCERHIDAEAIQIEILSEDFSKLALLRSDRCVEFHAKFGHYHKTRLPKICRDMAYHAASCDLFVGGSSPIVYRINLDRGRMMTPLETNLPGVNTVKVNPLHQLLGLGGEGCALEFWDPRDHSRASMLHLPTSLSHVDAALSQKLLSAEVSVCEFDIDGLTMAVGTSTGHVLIYDLRSSQPLMIKDHKYQQPIRDIKFHSAARKLISADTKIIKVWDRDSGDLFTSIQPEAPINSLCTIGHSGMLLAALEQHRIGAFYVPALGPAPKWSSFLDNLTEELEESRTTANIYEDYKFVTRDELVQLNLQDLIGTQMLRAYMHGYFMDIRLYNKVKSAADPFAYENYVKDRIKKKIDEKRSNRIVVQKRLPRVNKEYAQVLLDEKKPIAKLHGSDNDEEKTVVDDSTAAFLNPLRDSRFEKMFSDDRFQIDTFSNDYQRVHPTKCCNYCGHGHCVQCNPPQSSSQQAVEVSNKFRRVDDDDVEDADEVEAKQRRREKSADDDSDDEAVRRTPGRMARVRQVVAEAADADLKRQSQMRQRANLVSIEREIAVAEAALAEKRKRKPVMFELKKGYGLAVGDDDAGNESAKRPKHIHASFEDRIKDDEAHAKTKDRASAYDSVNKLPTHQSSQAKRERRGMKDILSELPEEGGDGGDSSSGRGGFRGRGSTRGRGGSRGRAFRGGSRGGGSSRGGGRGGGFSRGGRGGVGRGRGRGH